MQLKQVGAMEWPQEINGVNHCTEITVQVWTSGVTSTNKSLQGPNSLQKWD